MVFFAFDEGAIPLQPDFFYGGKHLSENFRRACNLLSLNDENIGFVDFLFSDRGQNIMTNSSLSIHVEYVNIYTRISTQMKIFVVSFWRSKTKQNQ